MSKNGFECYLALSESYERFVCATRGTQAYASPSPRGMGQKGGRILFVHPCMDHVEITINVSDEYE